MRDIVW